MELTVRPVGAEDAEQIVAVLNPIILARGYTVFDRPFSVGWERDYILQFPERGVFLVAEDSRTRRVVGFQSMEPFANYTRAFDHVGV